MLRYVIKRIILAVATVLLIACLTFFIMNMVPGGPFLSEKSPSPEVLAAMEAKYGLDKPVLQRLITWLGDLFKGDLGVSFKMQKNRPVATIIGELFPISAQVGAIALLFAICFGVPLGCLAAYNRGKWADSLLRVVMTIGVSIPSFVVATTLLILFSVVSKTLPASFTTGEYVSYIMPCFALGFYPMCYVGRLTRSSMLDVINQDYIRTARAKGLRTSKIIFKHALRNSLIPVITYLGPLTASVLTGGFVVEKVFNIPGMGRYFVQSISNRDYPIIMGTTLILATMVVIMNLIVDILYKVVDPRIDLGRSDM